MALTLPGTAFACRCATDTIATGYERAFAVVVGSVESVRPIEPVGVGSGSMATVNVSTAWKHAMPASLQVSSQTTCAYEWEAGRSYVLAIFQDAGRWSTSMCLGNHALPADAAVGWLRRHGHTEAVEAE